MTVVIDRVSEAQDQFISTISNVKDPVSNAVATVVDYVVSNVDEIPALPYAEQIPTPKEIIDNQVHFARELVTTNKSVALAVAKAAQPLTDQLLDRKSGPARSTSKAA